MTLSPSQSTSSYSLWRTPTPSELFTWPDSQSSLNRTDTCITGHRRLSRLRLSARGPVTPSAVVGQTRILTRHYLGGPEFCRTPRPMATCRARNRKLLRYQ
eukprot:g22526.t1